MKIFDRFNVQNETIIVLFLEKTDVCKLSTMKNLFIENKNVETIEIMIDQNLNQKIVIENLNCDSNWNLIIDSTDQKIILNVNSDFNFIDQTNRKIISCVNFVFILKNIINTDFVFILKIVFKNIFFDFRFTLKIDTSKKNAIVKNINFIIVFSIAENLTSIIVFQTVASSQRNWNQSTWWNSIQKRLSWRFSCDNFSI